MSDSILFLSRPALQRLTLIHSPAKAPRRPDPVWRLLLTALFAACAALSFAVVVIFGAPGGDPGATPGDAVHMRLALR